MSVQRCARALPALLRAARACSGRAGPPRPCASPPRAACRAPPAAALRAVRVVCCPPERGARPPCAPPGPPRRLTCATRAPAAAPEPDSKRRRSPGAACGVERDRVVRRLATAERARRAEYEAEAEAARPPVGPPAPYRPGAAHECACATDGRVYAVAGPARRQPARCRPGRRPPPPRCVALVPDGECRVEDGRRLSPCAHRPRVLLEIDRAAPVATSGRAEPAPAASSTAADRRAPSPAGLTSRIMKRFSFGREAPAAGARAIPAPPAGGDRRTDESARGGTPRPRCPCRRPASGRSPQVRRVHTAAGAGREPDGAARARADAESLERALRERESLAAAARGRTIEAGRRRKRAAPAGGRLELPVAPGVTAVRVRVQLEAAPGPEPAAGRGEPAAPPGPAARPEPAASRRHSWPSVWALRRRLSASFGAGGGWRSGRPQASDDPATPRGATPTPTPPNPCRSRPPGTPPASSRSRTPTTPSSPREPNSQTPPPPCGPESPNTPSSPPGPKRPRTPPDPCGSKTPETLPNRCEPKPPKTSTKPSEPKPTKTPPISSGPKTTPDPCRPRDRKSPSSSCVPKSPSSPCGSPPRSPKSQSRSEPSAPCPPRPVLARGAPPALRSVSALAL